MLRLPLFKLVNQFYQETRQDKHHRYKSWEHCFDYFGKIDDVDTASLHLAFYLASWGMYRGSSYLLWKDYKIFKPIVGLMKNYAHLRKFTLSGSESEIEDILEIKSKLAQAIVEVAGLGNGKQPTDTLLSKIILGTLGCVPAYDRLVRAGLKSCGLKRFSFTKKSLLEIIEFGKEHLEDIIKIKMITKENGVEYTDMKILDMYFWEVGAQEERSQ